MAEDFRSRFGAELDEEALNHTCLTSQDKTVQGFVLGRGLDTASAIALL